MGFETPRLPTQPREGSQFLGEHHHRGIKGDINSLKRRRGRTSKGSGKQMVSWVKS